MLAAADSALSHIPCVCVCLLLQRDWTALHFVAFGGYVETALALLRRGADIHANTTVCSRIRMARPRLLLLIVRSHMPYVCVLVLVGLVWLHSTPLRR